MARRRDDARVLIVESYEEFDARVERRRWRAGAPRRRWRAGAPRRRWRAGAPRRRWRRMRRRAIGLALAGALVFVALVGGLYILGPLNPFARTQTLALLPAPLAPAAYTHVAVDRSGWLWMAQSAPGLASDPADPNLLTLLDPGALFGDRVRARLCLGCAGMSGDAPALARIDDITPDPTDAHGILVAGYTTTHDGGLPVVIRITWKLDAAACSARQPCGTATLLLTTGTQIFIPNATNAFQTLLNDVVQSGARPLMALATANNGDHYLFLSARGTITPGAPTNVANSYQGLLRFDGAARSWSLVYHGPAGTANAQRIGPTSTITAIAVDHAGRAVYLADADRHAIFKLDLQAVILTARNQVSGLESPYIVAGALARFAGATITSSAPGLAQGQGISGWQGDGGPAIQAQLGVPRGLAFDAAGDLLVSDATNGRLRLITPAGTIWTVAGNGARTIGDDAAPAQTALRGMLDLAVDTSGRIFLAPGALTDSAGKVRLRVLNWGWSAVGNQTLRAKAPGQGTVLDPFAGLPPDVSTATEAWVVAPGSCVGQDAAQSCAYPYIVATGGTALGTLEPLAPDRLVVRGQDGKPLTPATTLTPAAPRVVALVPGTGVALVAGDGPQLTFLPPAGAPAIPSLKLPDGAQVTGIATLAPTTDAQLAHLTVAYILVAAQGMQDGPALLIYRAAPDTCGIGATPPANCTRFPGAPMLAANIALPLGASSGAIAAALSDDGTHAFALVAQPANNSVAIIDLSAFVQGGAPSVTAGLSVASPGAIVIRHDGQGAYILSTLTAGSDALVAIHTPNWLTQGVAATIPASDDQVIQLPQLANSSPVNAITLSADDAQLFVAGAASDGQGALVHLATGAFGAPQIPRALGSTKTDGPLLALTLAAGDQRLLALAAPNGAGKPGSLRAWATHDATAPAIWLDVPQDLGAITTSPDPAGIFVP